MEWIPIDKDWRNREEELSDEYVDVLISVNDDVCMAHRSGGYFVANVFETTIYFDIDDVDAWMPKPKPYRR